MKASKYVKVKTVCVMVKFTSDQYSELRMKIKIKYILLMLTLLYIRYIIRY